MKLRPFLRRLDAWVEPVVELWAGCVILVLSASFWIGRPARPVWDLEVWPATVGAILVGPLLVYRAWTRKRTEVHCDTCGERVPLEEVTGPDGLLYYLVSCQDCGPHLPAHDEPVF